MRLAALVSGGKDSISALYKAVKMGHTVVYLLNMLPSSEESYMFHYPNASLVRLQAEALEIPLIQETTAGEKEKELEDLKRLFERVAEEVDGIVTGALASRYQKSRIDRLCSELGLESIAPLWGIEPEDYWEWLLAENFRIVITGVAALGLDQRWLGRVIDEKALKELRGLAEKYKFHLGFEGGEAETFVLDMPLFKRKIHIEEAEIVWKGNHGYYVIKKAGLIEKGLPQP